MPFQICCEKQSQETHWNWITDKPYLPNLSASAEPHNFILQKLKKYFKKLKKRKKTKHKDISK